MLPVPSACNELLSEKGIRKPEPQNIITSTSSTIVHIFWRRTPRPTETSSDATLPFSEPIVQPSLLHLPRPNSFTDTKPSFAQKHRRLSGIADVKPSPDPISSIP
ncbi:unnamed protein product [Vicia faba]|uniref:Uncharacterized protein n=1 Tax=Vicia faba TaxID=3906 RepID=A0AAV1A2N8_VICFA|nr:unnamed protein product [Vicia faba]